MDPKIAAYIADRREQVLLLSDRSATKAAEVARLQTFPDDMVFHGSWTETMRQLGNAVPCQLARIVASGVRDKLSAAQISTPCTYWRFSL